MKKLVRNLRDPESARFWQHVAQAAARARELPAWKRGVAEPRESDPPTAPEQLGERTSRV